MRQLGEIVFATRRRRSPIPAVAAFFGPGVDLMQTVKNYRKGSRGQRDDDRRYEPPRDPFITKHTVFGAPDPG